MVFVGPNPIPAKNGTEVVPSMFMVTPPHWVEYVPAATRAKECTPGVVSPPVAATWIVFVNQL